MTHILLIYNLRECDVPQFKCCGATKIGAKDYGEMAPSSCANYITVCFVFRLSREYAVCVRV